MKNFFTTSRGLIMLTLLLCSRVVFGQTFQNTFLPAGDDNYVAGVAVSNNYWVIGNTSSFTPSVGTEHILFSKYSAVGGSVWDRKYYDGANTQITFTATDIQAGYSVFTPSPSNSTPPLSCSFAACPVPGPMVNSISVPNSKNYFFVSGWYKDPVFGVRRLLIMQLNSTGAVLWARTNLISTASGTYDEIGVSVESCPNGDVIAVSSVTNGAGITFPAVTRLNNAGVLIWRYHYPPATFEPPYNFIPHQSCIYKEQTPNIVNKPTGIAITGECNAPGAAGTSFFVMRIGYNGGLLWKFNYPLILPAPVVTNDVGWDIMFEAQSLGAPGTIENFIVTGLTNSMGVGPVAGALGFASRVAVTNGAFVNCYRFGIPAPVPPPVQMTYGQSIYQSTTAPANVVITGGCNDPASGIINDTYFLEMNITNGALVSAHRYPLTTPNYPRTESIVAVGAAYPTPGYFISTNAFDTYGGGTLTDGHVIKTDLFGGVNGATCLSDSLKIAKDSVLANIVMRCTDQKCDTIIFKQIIKKNINAPHIVCYSATKAGAEESSLVNPEEEIAVYPNPSTTNEVTLFFTADESKEFIIRVLDLNGKEKFNTKGVYAEGNQEVVLSTGALPAGIYMVTLSDGQSFFTTKLIKIKQ